MSNIFNTIIIDPILNVLVGMYKLFLYIGSPFAFGFAIVAITVAIRFIMLPFFQKQMETARKMQELKPHLDTLQKKHKNDSKKLQTEQMKLYQSVGINPASGCLVAIVQIPIFIGLYQTLQLFLTSGENQSIVSTINKKLYYPFLKINGAIDPHFFGLNLVTSPATSDHIGYYLVPVITGGLQFLQNYYTMPQTKKAEPKTEAIELAKDEKKEPEKKSTSEEFQQAMNTQMKYIFPVMIGYFSYSLPLGLSLYWNIFSLFSIIQQLIINKKKKSLTAVIPLR